MRPRASTIFGDQRDTGRHADFMCVLAGADGGGEALHETHADGAGGLAGHVVGEHGKFVAADTGDEIAWPGGRAEAIGDDLQDLIADRVAVRVVDRLEAVQIHEVERVLGAVGGRRFDRRG
ncbi:hypothetical protein AUC71_01255 [Methyloceanibacter marginalis]|uniref:Uncharacterized protein n=1 Tax=Methyloceanibacter marginalis TaxID=1774971 RepID=A0A1E3WB03_9HYPH|nr:hypothetical protein [Methyloceanibacter marginalis]ODS02971.1 hypothetical protein AUC71_01255 [Methyloceanibacter marginalis]